MTIHLYNQSNPNEKINKVLPSDEEHYIAVSGSLKNSTSILNPQIQIEILTPDENSGSYMTDNFSVLMNCNYMYIPDFKRYYFINNIVVDNYDYDHKRTIPGHSTHFAVPVLATISATVDPLKTYASSILTQKIYVNKASSNYNLLINDGYMPMKESKSYYTGVSSTSPFTDSLTWILGIVYDAHEPL